MVSILNLFNKDLGARTRALLVSISGLAAALVLVLQDVIDVLNLLPNSGVTAKIVLALLGAVSFIGRFTSLGNPQPEVEGR